ncbi:MAG: methionyl-tRNA formyltransferase, partial [Actinomycetota bacterium]|nr:methionyl-tRNA formyltransferase [Actinomycetota bacterium]
MAAGHEVALVVTQPDRKRGRGGTLVPTPVKAAAADLGIPTSHSVDDALEAGAELGVVVAFGKLIKAHVLARLPMVNLHFSLLPRWRGAAPVERAILAGDTETGV